jgi:excisionase family DNA binding protein
MDDDMTRRGLLSVTHDTDVDGLVPDTDATETRLHGAECWRGGWCPDDEDECCVNESVLTQGAAPRPLTDYVSKRSVEPIMIEDIAVQQGLPVRKLLLTVPEAGVVLSISRSKVYGLLASGSLPSVCIGRSRRIRVSDVEDFVAGGGREY